VALLRIKNNFSTLPLMEWLGQEENHEPE